LELISSNGGGGELEAIGSRGGREGAGIAIANSSKPRIWRLCLQFLDLECSAFQKRALTSLLLILIIKDKSVSVLMHGSGSLGSGSLRSPPGGLPHWEPRYRGKGGQDAMSSNKRDWEAIASQAEEGELICSRGIDRMPDQRAMGSSSELENAVLQRFEARLAPEDRLDPEVLEENLNSLLPYKARVEGLLQQGSLEKEISNILYSLVLMASGEIADRIQNGEATLYELSKLANDLAKTAFKLSGREVQKHLHLGADDLEELLRSSPRGAGNWEPQNRERGTGLGAPQNEAQGAGEPKNWAQGTGSEEPRFGAQGAFGSQSQTTNLDLEAEPPKEDWNE